MQQPEFLSDAYSQFRQRRLVGKSAKTAGKYEIELRRFDRFLGRPAVLGDLNDDTLSGCLQWMVGEELAAPTVNKCRACLVCLWRWCCRQGYVKVWPDIAKLQEPERVPLAWTEDEFSRLMGHLEQLPGRVGHNSAADWWTGLHLVMYDTAERISAVLDLRWSDLDLGSGWLVIPYRVRKGRTRDRAHHLHPTTLEVLRRLRGEGKDPLFAWPYCQGTLWNHYKAILQAANLASDRRSKFHRVRRTVATYFESRGGNATELLDHSKRAVTLAYLDPRFLQIRQASDLLPRLNPCSRSSHAGQPTRRTARSPGRASPVPGHH